MEKQRIWAFTEYEMEIDFEMIFESDKRIRWIGYGWEICPTTYRPHWQGCVYLHNACGSLETMKEILPKAHWEPKKKLATFEDNVNYCSKGGLFEEWGTRPEPGKRNDLIELRDQVMEGESVDNIAIENPHMYHQYGRTLERIELIRLRKQHRSWMTKGYWVHGPAGVGKSEMVHKDWNEATHFKPDLTCKWWDGYKGQPIIILEDFRGEYTLGQLFRLVDRYPHTVPWRCKESVPFLAKEVWITCNQSPYELYDVLDKEENSDQFERRFETIYMEQRCSEGNTGTSEQVSMDRYMNGEA